MFTFCFQIYDDVSVIAKIAPYAETCFRKRAPLLEKSNNDNEANLDEDEEGYVDIDGTFGGIFVKGGDTHSDPPPSNFVVCLNEKVCGDLKNLLER